MKKLCHGEFQVSIADFIVEVLSNKELIFENADYGLLDMVVSKTHSFYYEVYYCLFVNSPDLIVRGFLEIFEELFRVEYIKCARKLIFNVRSFFSFT